MEERCHPHEDLMGEPLRFNDRRVLLFVLPNNVLLCYKIDDVLGILEHNQDQRYFTFPYGRQQIDLREFEREVIDRHGNTFRLIPTNRNNTYRLERTLREAVFGDEGWQAPENINPMIQNALDQFQELIQEANLLGREIEIFEETMEHAILARIDERYIHTLRTTQNEYIDLIGRMRIARERLGRDLQDNARNLFLALTNNTINNLQLVRNQELEMLEAIRDNFVAGRRELALRININALIIQTRREYEDDLHRRRHRLLAELELLRNMFQGDDVAETVEASIEAYERGLARMAEMFEREFPNRNRDVDEAILQFDERINQEREELDNIEQRILE